MCFAAGAGKPLNVVDDLIAERIPALTADRAWVSIPGVQVELIR